MRGTFNGGKAEQKGIEVQAEWRVNDRFSLELGGFMADPEFSERFEDPDGDPVEAGWPMPDSPEEKLWVAAEYRVPGFLIRDGEFWTRLSYSYQGEYWNSLQRNPVLQYISKSTIARIEDLIPGTWTIWRTPWTRSSRLIPQ